MQEKSILLRVLHINNMHLNLKWLKNTLLIFETAIILFLACIKYLVGRLICKYHEVFLMLKMKQPIPIHFPLWGPLLCYWPNASSLACVGFRLH